MESLDDLTRLDREPVFGADRSEKPSLSDKLRMLPLLERMSRWLPRNRRGRGACQQVVRTGDEVRLSELPVLKCWPFDGGRFVTFPLVHTVDPESGVRNVGMYRMQVFSERSTGMHWHVHKTGERHYRAYRRLGRRMPWRSVWAAIPPTLTPRRLRCRTIWTSICWPGFCAAVRSSWCDV